MTDQGPITRQDLVEGNVDKVFRGGFAADRENGGDSMLTVPTAEIAMRPGFAISAVEMDAAKAMSMSRLVPRWLRAHPEDCLMVLQLSKRWTQYDPRTNSWIHFDPLTIAQSMYWPSQKEDDPNAMPAYMSAFIRALVEAFAPTQRRLRYSYTGEGQDRRCTCSGLFRGETEPHEYTTPPLKQITPKRSSLWQSNPDQQLAYYASRNWGRLYISGIMHGIYDPDEVESFVGPDRARDVTPVPDAALRERLAATVPTPAPEGISAQGVEDSIAGRTPSPAPAEPRRRRKRAEPREAAPEPKKRAQEAPKAEAPKVPPLPNNPEQYRTHVSEWLSRLDTEEAIEAHWASEMKLRNACGLVSSEREAIRMLVEQRIQALRDAQG